MTSGSSGRRTDELLRVALLACFVLLAYLPSFGVPFVFDDIPNIVLNSNVQPDNWQDLGRSLDARGARDRPVAMFTFALNYLWGGLDTTSYHVVNLLVHVANATLLFFLLRELARAPRSPEILGTWASTVAFSGALIWALHPVNTQAVTYIVQRMASLAAFFYLVAVLAYVLWRSGRVRGSRAWPSIGLAFALGLGAKMNVVTLPAALLLVDVAFFSGFRRVHLYVLGAVAVVLVAFASFYAGHQFPYLLEPSPDRGFSGIERALTQTRVIWHYLGLLIWPAADRLQLDYEVVTSHGLLDPITTLWSTIGLGILTALALWRLGSRSWLPGGWLFFLLALSVESSIVLLEMVFEHRLYLPSTLLIGGVVATAATAMLRAGQSERLLIPVLVVAGLLCWQTMDRNEQWRDLGELWATDLERGASPERAALNAAVGYLRNGKPEKALEMLAHVHGKGDQSAKVLQARGEALYALGRSEEALTAFRQVLELQPNWTRTAYFAGRALLQRGRPEAAAAVLSQMREAASESVFTPALAASIEAALGREREALETLGAYLEGPRHLKTIDRSFLYMHKAQVHAAAGDREAAAAALKAALEADPDNWAARTGLKRLHRDVPVRLDLTPPRRPGPGADQ